jgi:hypothetical protein
MRRALLLCCLLPTMALAAAAPVAAHDETVTCEDFLTQQGAQALLEADDDYEQALDPDGDGVACDDLPRRDQDPPPRTATPPPATEPPTVPATEAAPEPTATATTVATPTTAPTATATPTATRAATAAGAATPEAEDDPTAAPTDDADAAATAEPLAGRFGGSRESFEAIYGEPVDEEAGEYPDGFVYEVEEVGEANVFYHRGYVNYLTLTLAEATDPGGAAEVVAPFLPVDFEAVGDPAETDDGGLLVVGHSVVLEERFAAATYDRYGASGERGDLFYLLRLDDGGDVTAVEIGLGDALQAPVEVEAAAEATEAPAAESTAEPDAETGSDADAAAEAYLAAARVGVDTLIASTDTFAGLIAEPDFGDDGYVEAFVAELGRWQAVYAEAQELTPTPRLERFHADYLAAAGLLSGAADDFIAGLTSQDDQAVEELLAAALDQYSQGSAALADLDERLTDAGV